MSILQQVAQVWILIPVVLLLVVGFALTIQAGHARLSTSQGARKLVENLSSTIAFLGVSVALLAMVQSWIGFNLKDTW